MSAIAGVWNLGRGQRETPLANGRSLVFDGRLDNREELLAQLSDHAIPQSSDSALILEAFIRWGADCLRRLNGEFAVAIFDADRQQLILARDPVGCRPLYYWTNGNTFVFGSEIKTILAHADVPSRPNKDLIADYFVRDRLPYEDFGETFFEGIRAVLPGERLTVATGGLTTTRFWDFDTGSVVRFTSYADYAERLRELLFQAVKRRLRTAHPVGLAVSGGLDSSIVLCVADQLRKDGAIVNVLLPISLTAPGIETTEEARFLSLLESSTGLRIERLPFGAPGELADLDDAAWHSESPRFDDGWFAQRAMFAWTRAQGARTLLTGHWSDQLSFATGYLSDLVTTFKWREVAAHLDEYSRWFVDADPRYFRRRFRRELAFHLTSHRLRRIARPLVRERRIADGRIAPDVAARVERPRPAHSRPRCHSAHARAIYQTVRANAHRLQFEAGAKLAAGCGVQWTTPFLDRDLIAYLIAVPGEIQNRGGVPRALLRDAMRGIVPDRILERRWRNDDRVEQTRELAYLSPTRTLDAAHALGLVTQPLRIDRETLAFAGLESWSRVFFSDRLSATQHPRETPRERAQRSEPGERPAYAKASAGSRRSASRGGGSEPTTRLAGEPVRESEGQSPSGVDMDTADPATAPKHDREKLPYSPPKLTVHGDLRTITAAKQSDRSEAGQPKTFNSGMP